MSVIHCHVHGVTTGYGGDDKPKCLRCAKRHAEARRTGANVADLLRTDRESAKEEK